MAITDYTDNEKQKARTRMTTTRKRKPAKCALFMPATECLCIQEALRNGTIDLNTKIVAIDRCSNVCQIIWYKLYMELGFSCDNITTICGELKDLNLKLYGPFDYAWFDCCGECTSSIMSAITKPRLFTIGADIAVTFQAHARHKRTKQFLRSEYAKMVSAGVNIPIKKLGNTPCDVQKETVNAIIGNLWTNYSKTKLMKFEPYKRTENGKKTRSVRMFSAQLLVK